MIGRADRLRMREAVEHWKARGVDLSAILHRVEAPEGEEIHHSQEQDHHLEKAMDNELIERCLPALENKEQVHFSHPIFNTNRTVGGMLSGEIARRHGGEGLPDGAIRIDFEGVAGQSFGAWAARGSPSPSKGRPTTTWARASPAAGSPSSLRGSRPTSPRESIVVGNVALYGATAGEAYFRGFAGERFAVRNSGRTNGRRGRRRPRLRVHDRRGRRGARSHGPQLRRRDERRRRVRPGRGRGLREALQHGHGRLGGRRVRRGRGLLRGMVERHLEWTESAVAEGSSRTGRRSCPGSSR